MNDETLLETKDLTMKFGELTARRGELFDRPW